MNKLTRRIIYLTFFLIFFVVSTLLIFYSLGFRYNFEKNIIEKNGAFYIKSYPRNASIYLDNKKTRQTTPGQLINITPGRHELEVRKNNYVSWKKTLEVFPGQTTFAEEIGLFLAEREKTIMGPGSDDWLVSQSKNIYAYLTGNQLWMVNTETAKAFQIYEFTAAPELISFSPNDQQLLIHNRDGYQIFDINQLTLKKLALPLTDKIIWDNEDNNFLWYLADGAVFRHNILLSTETEKIRPADDFALTGKYLVTQRLSDATAVITQYHKETGEQIRILQDISLGKINLLLANQQYLIFSVGSRLYLQTPTNEKLDFPATQVKIYGRYLLISDGHEIWLYDYNDNWKEIIDRSSQIVSEIQWHPNGSYFIDEINGRTRLLELDGHDQRNAIELLANPLKKMYLFNRNGSRLFVLTPEENFYLEIQ